MTALHELESRLQKLGDVREILTSMKNLAYMETRKLTRHLETQRRAVRLIETAAADFLAHYPQTRREGGSLPEIVVLIGSERGFCGNFNEQLLAFLGSNKPASPRLATLGRKLAAKLEGDPRLAAALDGPSVAEEVTAVMDELASKIGGLHGEAGPAALDALFHDEKGEVRRMSLLPPFRDLAEEAPRHPFPPLLNLPPETFYVELVDQYLFAALQLALYTSLLAENQRRVQHLEGAVRHLDEQLANLEHRRRQLRQEEIIEEIEVILLNATDPDGLPQLR